MTDLYERQAYSPAAKHNQSKPLGFENELPETGENGKTSGTIFVGNGEESTRRDPLIPVPSSQEKEGDTRSSVGGMDASTPTVPCSNETRITTMLACLGSLDYLFQTMPQSEWLRERAV